MRLTKPKTTSLSRLKSTLDNTPPVNSSYWYLVTIAEEAKSAADRFLITAGFKAFLGKLKKTD